MDSGKDLEKKRLAELQYGLPREVLKWIQSLDLAYSVKSPKRAFANGFLVAEIFSRYDKTVEMHSFDNGTSTKVRKDNWKQLQKYFLRRGIPYDEAQVNRIMLGHDGVDVIQFLKTIYTILTRIEIPETPELKVLPQNPPFARFTASTKIGARLRHPDYIEEKDEAKIQAEIESTLQDHNIDVRESRKETANMYKLQQESKVSSTGSVGKQERIIQGQKRRITSEKASDDTIEVKQVQVKTFAGDVHSLRARMEMNASSLDQGMGSPSIYKPENRGELDVGSSEGPGAFTSMSSAGGVSEILATSLGGLSAQEYLKSVRTTGWDASTMNEAVGIFSGLSSGATINDLAAASLRMPRDFVKLTHWLDSLIVKASEQASASGDQTSGISILLDKISEVYSTLGTRMTELDAEQTGALFESLVLPGMMTRLSNSSKTSHTLRQASMRVMSSFYAFDSESRILIIKNLKDTLENDALLYCLVPLSNADSQGSMSEDLLSLYVYYATIGIGHSQSTIRVAALQILAALARTDVGVNTLRNNNSLLQQIEDLLDSDTLGWEESAGLLAFATSLLSCLSADPNDEGLASRMHNIIGQVYTEKAAHNVKLIGASLLAPVQQSIANQYVRTLCSLDARNPMANAVIQGSSPVRIGSYTLNAACESWDPVLVVSEVQSIAAELDNLEEIHLLVLSAAISNTDLQDPQYEGIWKNNFATLSQYVTLALADANSAQLACDVLRHMILVDPMYIDQNSPLVALLPQFVFPAPDEGKAADVSDDILHCQDVVLQFLREVTASSNTGSSVRGAVVGLLSAIREKFPLSIKANPSLQNLIHEMEGGY